MKMQRKYERKLEELQKKRELVQSTIQVTLQDILNNPVKSGEGSSCDTKGKCKEICGDELAMKDSRRKKRTNRHCKWKDVATQCDIYGKTHTGMCYRIIGACLKYGQFGHQVKNCPNTWMKSRWICCNHQSWQLVIFHLKSVYLMDYV